MNRKTKLKWWKPIKYGTSEGWRYECLKELTDKDFKGSWKAYVGNRMTDVDLTYLIIGSVFTRLLSKSKINKIKIDHDLK